MLVVAFAALVAGAAGCTGALPPNTPPAEIPERAPQLVCEGEWNTAAGTLTIHIDQGPTYRPAGSEIVDIRVEDRDQPVHWVSGPETIEARQDPPLGPGDAITVAVTERTEDVRVIWEGDRDAIASLCEFERPGVGTR